MGHAGKPWRAPAGRAGVVRVEAPSNRPAGRSSGPGPGDRKTILVDGPNRLFFSD
jgi:hypothetical protein